MRNMKKLINAEKSDFDRIRSIYLEIINNTPNMKKYVKWEYGKHPNDDMLNKYIDDGDMYMFMENETILGVVALTFYQTEEYDSVDWKADASGNEIMVVHLLGVTPKEQGNGYARKIIEAALDEGRKRGAKVCRLDALSTNIPAQKLYEGIGFEYRETQEWYVQNVGWIDFCLYEYML